MKWFLFAVGFLVAAVVAVITMWEVAWAAMMLGLASLPIAAGIAILRYRLYEIDRLVSRTIAYAVVTGGLIVVYLVVNLGLTTAFSSLASGNSAVVAASTLVVAAVFAPLRRRVQSSSITVSIARAMTASGPWTRSRNDCETRWTYQRSQPTSRSPSGL